MTIEDRNMKPGTKLAARFKGKTYSAEVVQSNEGLRYRLVDGDEYNSISSAAKAITKGAINGWKFWSLANKDGEPADRAKPKAKDSEPKTKTVVQIKKLPNQKGVPEGEVKYYFP